MSQPFALSSPRRKILGIWLGGVVVLGVLSAVVAHLAAESPSTSATDPIGKIQQIAADHRVAAATLSGELLDGSRYDPAAYAGHVTVINAWGSWCTPCQKELPVLRRLASATYPAPVRFLGLDVADRQSSAQAMVKQYALPYPSLFDPDKTAYVALAPSLAENVPSTVVVDARGRIAAIVIGPVDEAQMSAYLDEVAAEKP